MQDAGCVGFSDDGRPVTSGELMRRALEYARPFGAVIISHAEDLSLVGEGVMNDGYVSAELGLKGIPWVAEDAATARDVMLAEFTGSRITSYNVCYTKLLRDPHRRGRGEEGGMSGGLETVAA